MIVDSSVWLEVFLGGPLQEKCSQILNKKDISLPTSVVYEVYRKLKHKVSEEIALEATAFLSAHNVVDLNREIMLLAADISLEYDLGFTDSVVLATARATKTELVTLDNDFSNMSDVVVLK